MAVYTVYFSPTGGTRRTVRQIVKSICENVGKREDYIDIDVTLPTARSRSYNLKHDDLLILGLPVYSGRIPAIVEGILNNIKGSNTKAVAVSVYGNRDYEDALLETTDILTQNGFNVISAGAFIAEHSYTDKVGGCRPDSADLKKAADFGKKTAEKINKGNAEPVKVKGNTPYKERSPSLNIAPDTTNACYDCMQCAISCPTEAISFENPRKADTSKCILCMSCVKICPVNAKVCENAMLAKAISWLESSFTARREPELFL